MRYPVLLSLALAGVLGCGAAQTEVIRCEVAAVRALPDDPLQITPYDTVDLIDRLRACKFPPGDAGGR